MGRRAKAAPTKTKIYYGYADSWHGFVMVGKKADGSDDVRHCSAVACQSCRKAPKVGCACYERCAAKVRKLEADKAAGSVARTGRVLTLEQWLIYWMDNVVSNLRYATIHRGYGWAVKKIIGPDGIGGWPLDHLDEHIIEKFLRRLSETGHARTGAGLKAASVASVKRTLEVALNEAVRRRQGIARNPCEFVRRPKPDELEEADEITPLFVAEVQRIVEVARHRRNGTRWTVGLPLGFRQGEALGMPWHTTVASTRDRPLGLDPDGGYVIIGRKAERRTWEHGCADPVACARPHCRTEPCRPMWDHGCADPAACRSRGCWCPQRATGRCRIHKSCPAPCPPGCTDHARTCKDKTGGGIVFGPVKSKAGWRKLALGEHMKPDLAAHREAQDAERDAAGDAWREHGLVWCNTDGSAIDPKSDWREWKAILRQAEVRDARVHDGRHTAATMLLLQGVAERIVLEIMGWSDKAMLRRYQHVLDEMRVEATKRLEDLLYRPAPAAPDPAVNAELTQAHLDKALADVARLQTQAQLDQALIELGQLRAQLASTSTDQATDRDLARVIPLARSA